MDRPAIGHKVRRSEDLRLLTGRGRYVDDIGLPRQAFAVVLRSPHAHARLLAIDGAAALARPGVLAVLTGAEAAADGLGPLPCAALIKSKDGRPAVMPPRPVLATAAVRHVGDPVAFVVAETLAAAKDAAELVAVDYEPLAAVVDATRALEPGAPSLWREAPGNLCFDWESGDRAATERAFAAATRVVEVELRNNRLVANPIEPRGALGDYDAGQDRYTLYTCTQGAHLVRRLVASGVLGIAENQLRVVTTDVGGGFGTKFYAYPEQALVLWAARRLGRPVKWIAERGESFLSDSQGRDQHSWAALALDEEGRILALRVRTHANLGAYLSTLGTIIPTAGGTRALTGPYAIAAAHVEVKGVFTNTVPVDAYRGAGRPEAIYLIERLVDAAARALAQDRIEFRRRNLVPAAAMPYTTALAQVYDSGDFGRLMEEALRAADWAGFEARRAGARARGRLAGIGLATYVDPCGGNRDQMAEIRFDPGGGVTVLIGSQATGQGHETAYAQIVADQLGVPFERITVVQGDTDRVAYGRGTTGSRSLPIGGTALLRAGERVVAKGRRIAAHNFEAAEADVEFEAGRFRVAGTDRTLDILEVAAAAFDPARVPADLDLGLDQTAHVMAHDTTYPNGCHVCELEVDRDTGAVEVTRYTVVDDFGRIVNPMLVEGQVHGGVAQGLGQALLEQGVYDANGQLLTASFVDYALPRADHLPELAVSTVEVPCLTNPLGVKGCGEAGAIAAPPAVVSALLDALAPLGVSDLEMPATPERLWRLIAAHAGG